MYYPVLRAKQNELIAMRELSALADPQFAQFVRPVFEPVRANVSALVRTIQILNEKNIMPLVIVNPTLGDFADSARLTFLTELKRFAQDCPIDFIPCIATNNDSLADLENIASQLVGGFTVFVNNGFSSAYLDLLKRAERVLVNDDLPMVVQQQLSRLVIIKDGFNRAPKNSDYKFNSNFGRLHCDFKTAPNVIGFGDYTITGGGFSESGGPAHVVAIHLSYIDPAEYHTMFIQHFLSYDDGSPAGPGAKFGDAVAKLADYFQKNPQRFDNTAGLADFLNLATTHHFPGLGVAKRLSIMHHIETIYHYLLENRTN